MRAYVTASYVAYGNWGLDKVLTENEPLHLRTTVAKPDGKTRDIPQLLSLPKINLEGRGIHFPVKIASLVRFALL